MIEVLIDNRTVLAAIGATVFQMRVLSICREAGIPISGVFLFKGVHRGSIHIEHSDQDKTHRVRWYDTDEKPTGVGDSYELTSSGYGEGYEWRVLKRTGEKQ